MKKRKITLSIKIIPITFVLILGVFPLLFLQSNVNNTVQQIILENTTKLTRGILEQSRSYLNHLFEDMEGAMDSLLLNEIMLEHLKDPQIDLDLIKDIKDTTDLGNLIEDLVIVNISDYRSLTTFPLNLDEFSNSEQVALLLENPSRHLLMGRPPVGSEYSAGDTMWHYQVLKYEKSKYIIAASVNSEQLSGLLSQFAEVSNSTVILISADNQTIPSDSRFFDYPFAAKALSRSLDSRYNIIYESFEENEDRENLMVQTYTDPIYLYNLVIVTPQETLFRGFETVERVASITMVFLSLSMLASGLFLAFLISFQVREFIHAADSIGAGQYNIQWRSQLVNWREVTILNNAMNTMAEEVKNSRSTLELRVKEGSEELKRTRQSLIHSEKMAIMGRQGAKVAHEINNPLGVAVTASSHLSSVVLEIEKKFSSDSLTKSDFNTLLDTAREVTNIVDRNLRQATGMILGFKNFAADQAKENREVITIDKYVGEIIKSFSYELRKTDYIIEYDGDESLEIETVPSILYQTLTNLINNSVLHGFEDRDRGKIRIDIKKSGDDVVILYSDDGKGIKEENISQLYKPFYTTKSGQGGTGLGLNIIKDLIEEGLNGTIECESVLGEGTLFTIRFPMDQEVVHD